MIRQLTADECRRVYSGQFMLSGPFECARKPRLGDLATTIAHVPWGVSEEPGDEASNAMFEGAYTNYHVCPPGTVLESVDYDYLQAATVQLELSNDECAIFAEMHF